MAGITYRSGYKYQLAKDYVENVAIQPDQDIVTEYISLGRGGELFIKEGYAWDGPSGPTIDTWNFMRGSLVHDALYQLMRDAGLSEARWREAADKELRRLCREDGMSAPRAWWVYQGVRRFGDPAASPAHQKPLLYAPPLNRSGHA